MPSKANISSIVDKWHVAYFGTKITSLRKILDTGDLHATGRYQEFIISLLSPANRLRGYFFGVVHPSVCPYIDLVSVCTNYTPAKQMFSGVY